MTVVPLTTAERPGWLHRLEVSVGGRRRDRAITEQMRTVSAARFTGAARIGVLSDDEIARLRFVLAQMPAI